MDPNYSRLKLKLDMVYRGLSLEEARSQFEALAAPPAPPPVVRTRKRITEAKQSPAKS